MSLKYTKFLIVFFKDLVESRIQLESNILPPTQVILNQSIIQAGYGLKVVNGSAAPNVFNGYQQYQTQSSTSSGNGGGGGGGGDGTNSSPASSSRSYRRIKELKNSINSKKNGQGNPMGKPPAPPPPIPHQLVDVGCTNEEDYLKKSLMNSFTKRRQRKGSLPEINAERAMNGDINGGESSFIGTVVNLDDAGSDQHGSSQHHSDLYYHPLTSTQETFATLHDDSLIHSNHYQQHNQTGNFNSSSMMGATGRRASRKSAFVLEVFRTSMFRSKSLTDLNSSLVKSENHYATMGNTTHTSNNLNTSGCCHQASYKNLNNLSNGISASQLNISIHEK